MTKLGVNVDHVATVRQARRETFPDPVRMAQVAVAGGAEGITAHLREDRRHIQDDDIVRLKESLSVPLNLEMAAVPEIITFAKKTRPEWVCLVPEKRMELTTEGGLDLSRRNTFYRDAVGSLKMAGIRVSIFIEPDEDAVRAAKEGGADAVELHTGVYARTFSAKREATEDHPGKDLTLNSSCQYEIKRIQSSAARARDLGLIVNAGHGLDYDNAGEMAKAFPFDEFNIGFSIIARALEVGLTKAVEEMKSILRQSVCVAS